MRQWNEEIITTRTTTTTITTTTTKVETTTTTIKTLKEADLIKVERIKVTKEATNRIKIEEHQETTIKEKGGMTLGTSPDSGTKMVLWPGEEELSTMAR